MSILIRTEKITKFPSNMIIGILEYFDNGDITAREWPSHKILGYYKASSDKTTDFYGRILTNGNSIQMLFSQG